LPDLSLTAWRLILKGMPGDTICTLGDLIDNHHGVGASCRLHGLRELALTKSLTAWGAIRRTDCTISLTTENSFQLSSK
jgi:hypothetical protein